MNACPLGSGRRLNKIKRGGITVHILINVLHIISCFVLVIVVLLQAGKGASMGAAFGGSSQTVFGSSGAGTFLGKMTTAVAVVFMLTSLFLSYASIHKGSSLMEGASGCSGKAGRTCRTGSTRHAPAPAQNTAPPVSTPQSQPAK
jgi:preprotein translocase subunit SecG